MIDQTFYDEGTLPKAYRALSSDPVLTGPTGIVSKLLSAGLLIRERTPDSAVSNEPGSAGPYPMSASLPEQRRAFVLDHLPATANPLLAAELEKFLAGPTGDAQSADAVDYITLQKLSDIDRDPAVTPFLPPRDYEDQVSYDRGWRNGREAAFHIAESDAQKRGWNAALDELIEKRLSFEVLRTDINSADIDTGTPVRQSVREILLGMKKL